LFPCRKIPPPPRCLFGCFPLVFSGHFRGGGVATLSVITHKLNVSGHMWTFFHVLLCATLAQSLSAPFSYTLYKLLAPYRHVKFVLLFADQDGAEPSGNSVAASNLLRLYSFLDRPELRDKAARLFTAFTSRLTRVSIALPEMTSALMCYHDSPIQVSSRLDRSWILQ
jgi:hypothetical protein